jgi:hypothetical protein
MSKQPVIYVNAVQQKVLMVRASHLKTCKSQTRSNFKYSAILFEVNGSIREESIETRFSGTPNAVPALSSRPVVQCKGTVNCAPAWRCFCAQTPQGCGSCHDISFLQTPRRCSAIRCGTLLKTFLKFYIAFSNPPPPPIER